MIGRDSGPQFQDWGALPVRNHWLESHHVSVQQVGCLVFVLALAVIRGTYMRWHAIVNAVANASCCFAFVLGLTCPASMCYFGTSSCARSTCVLCVLYTTGTATMLAPCLSCCIRISGSTIVLVFWAGGGAVPVVYRCRGLECMHEPRTSKVA